MLELYFYITYFCLSTLAIFCKTNNLNILLWFSTTFLLLFFVHMKPPMWDIAAYELYAKFNNDKAIIFGYFGREFVYYRILRFFTSLMSFKYALVIFDLFVLFVVYRVFTSLRVPLVYWYSFFTCFIIILGYQNIHRQFIASMVFMLLIAFVVLRSYKNKSIQTKFLALVAPFVHNIAAIGLILIFPKILKKIRVLVIPIIACLGYYAINFLSSTKSMQESGFNFAHFLFIFFNLSLLGYIIKNKNNLNVDKVLLWVIYIYASTLFAISLFVLPGAGQERVGYFFITAFFPFLVVGARNFFKQKQICDFSLHMGLHIPIYFSPAYKFLTT